MLREELVEIGVETGSVDRHRRDGPGADRRREIGLVAPVAVQIQAVRRVEHQRRVFAGGPDHAARAERSGPSREVRQPRSRSVPFFDQFVQPDAGDPLQFETGMALTAPMADQGGCQDEPVGWLGSEVIQ